jgi:hypothetical protein
LTLKKAGIYVKNTDLDKANYDSRKAEDEQLIAYYRNYMNDEKISDEERQMYKEKVEKLVSAQNARIKKEGEDYIDAAQIKDMIDQMV